jgi:hypothetical protein
MLRLFRHLPILSTFLAWGLLDAFYLNMVNEHEAYQMLHAHVSWWITLQVLQIALHCLSALFVFRLISGRHGTVAALSRMGPLPFLLCPLAYTMVIGIGTGLLVAHADALALAARVCLGPQSSIIQVITAYSGSPIGTGLWVLSSLGWIVGSLVALLTLSKKNELDAVAFTFLTLRAASVE